MEENLKQASADGLIRIVLYGPESTGKTTLARQLAEHFQTNWAPEFAREYLQRKWDEHQQICTVDDMMPIAYGQNKLEAQAINGAQRFVFSDTNLLVTRVFSEMYYGYCDPMLEKASRKHQYDLFLLTDIDVPWQADDLRDRPNQRQEMMAAFRKALHDHKKPYVLLSGNQQERFDKAIRILQELEQAKQSGFNSFDFVQLYNRGISFATVSQQLRHFRNGIGKANLDRPARVDDGIVRLGEHQFDRYAALFDNHKKKLSLAKFVPASGAASRMFKFLSEFLQEFDPAQETINAYINRKGASSLSVFLAGLEKFPFYRALIDEIERNHPDFHQEEADSRFHRIITHLLSSSHWDFANRPKGVLPFHKYEGHVATAVEEHLNETVHYATGRDNICRVHFTVSEQHRPQFENIVQLVKPGIEKQTGSRIDVTFSYQHPATDTLAVTPENEPFRLADGSLFFRPGGHGALIENLNELDADIIFVKNIDNVIQNHVHEIARYKKALAGMLIELQQAIRSGLEMLNSSDVSEQDVDGLVYFMQHKLNVDIPKDFPKYALPYKIEFIREAFHRPIRVCGVVRNEGEPGGGPFWIRNNGKLSLQIVESSQVDHTNPEQVHILKSATHFNPVDLVCGVRDPQGKKYNLPDFVDPGSGFIAEKTKNGRPLRAYELPGLWNGGMAYWNTVFVEVPLMTFNPVKTVNDLLKPAHQPL